MSISRTAHTFDAPIIAAQGWLKGVEFPPDRPLINVSQAAPADPPPLPLRQAMAEIALNDPSAHFYGPVLGLPDLRAEIAAQWSTAYDGTIPDAGVAITSGCNQAFCAAIATLTGEGDEVILVTPWYFNHKMWLDMSGVRAVPLPARAGLLPDPEDAAARITARTRAIVLVSPNNPGGVEYPAPLLRAFFDLAQSRGIALILDETYRDFHATPSAPHDLFTDPDWPRTLIHLYSFSKAFHLTGHRVGALIAGADRIAQVERFLDTVTICPAQIGQRAALWGLRNLSQWLAGERDEILARRAALQQAFDPLSRQGWQIAGLGAYFAYLRHPFDESAATLAPRLVREAGLLALPGTMFAPEGDAPASAHIRLAFANLDRTGIATALSRLSGLCAR